MSCAADAVHDAWTAQIPMSRALKMVVNEQASALYAHLAGGEEIFEALRDFIADSLDGCDEATRALWRALVASSALVPIHNGHAGVHTTCFLLLLPAEAASTPFEQSLRAKMLRAGTLFSAKVGWTVTDGDYVGIIVTPSTVQIPELQILADELFADHDPDSPSFNRVVLIANAPQDEHQDSSVGGDPNMLVVLSPHHNPTQVRHVPSSAYPVRGGDAMLPPTDWDRQPWIPMPRASTRDAIRAAVKKGKRTKTSSEQNCFGEAGAGLPAVVFRSTLPHRGTASDDGSFRLAWFQTRPDRSWHPTGAIFNDAHGNANWRTWYDLVKADAKKARKDRAKDRATEAV
eukprot:gene19880-13120_t